ncbi:MAG: CopG family antitoxin [Chloroflexota bacterium]
MTTTAPHQALKLTDDGLELVEHQGDIPTFQDEAEEAAYWETHTLGDGLLEQMKPAREIDPRLPDPRAASTSVTIRLEADTLHRLRTLAARKKVGYQTLLKRFVVERLYEEEQRAGL